MAKAKRSRYGVHPGIALMNDWVRGLKAKTGRDLAEWVAFIRKEGPPDETARRDWLKTKLKLGTNTALWLAERSVAAAPGLAAEDTPEGYMVAAERWVADQYAGPKAALIPLRDALLDLGDALGVDVKWCPCKTMVPLYRNHVIAQIKPSTRTRIDFGLALGDTPAKGRLIDTGGFAKKDRITHRFAIGKPADIDDEVRRWLKKAYDRDE